MYSSTLHSTPNALGLTNPQRETSDFLTKTTVSGSVAAGHEGSQVNL